MQRSARAMGRLGAETYGPMIALAGLAPEEHAEGRLMAQRRANEEAAFFAACNDDAYLAHHVTS
jgi:hypothetical protein